ncbi:hypothetical protein HF521_020023 [Silurus meridionalis]|uniref:Ig-like domain-containing protein n=1 Tax=Silurus meridionalis TaxID=175797 RepID=A0A8T0BI48_SILME|nr:hypothetical protein HF521_020023 [Silurus meridionalis]
MQTFKIRSVGYSDRGNYTCRGQWIGAVSSEMSDAVTLTISEKPKPTVRVNQQSFVYAGDTITLSCELQQMTGWVFFWRNQYYRSKSPSSSSTCSYTELSDHVEITVRERPQAVLSVFPQNWLTEGDSVTLSFSGSIPIRGRAAVSASLGLLFIALLFLMILLWCCKKAKGSDNIYSNVDLADMRRTGKAEAESSKVIYAQVTKKIKAKRNIGDIKSVADFTVYKEMKHNTE